MGVLLTIQKKKRIKNESDPKVTLADRPQSDLKVTQK